MSSERNMESGVASWSRKSFGQREGPDNPSSSQIEPENSDAGEIHRLKAKNARQDKHIERLNKRVAELNEHEQYLTENLNRLQEVANGKNIGGEKVMEEMEVEISQLKKRLKNMALKLSRVEKDAKERNERKETSIKRVEAKVADRRLRNEDANQEVLRKAWIIKELEERVAELNQQVQGTATLDEMRLRLQEKTAELSVLEAENQRNASKTKKVDDLEAKMVVLNRALQDKKAMLSNLEEVLSRGSSRWKGKGTEQSDTMVPELNQRLEEEVAKDSKMQEAARHKEKEVKLLEARVAELSQRLRGEAQASQWKGKGVEQSDEAVTKLNQRLQEEMAKAFTMEEAVWRKEKEMKGLEAKVVELGQRLRRETEASRQKQKETKRLEVEVAELTEASRRKERDMERLEAQKADSVERRMHEKTAKLSNMEEVARQNSRKERENNRLVAELEVRLQEQSVKLSNMQEALRKNSRIGENHNSERLKAKVSRLGHYKASTSMKGVARRWEQKIRDLSIANQKQRNKINQVQAALSCVKTTGEEANNPTPQALVNIFAVKVADLVRILNAQIEYASSVITDSLSNQEPFSSGEASVALNELCHYLGPWLFNDLRRRSNKPETEYDPLITQIALQTVFVRICNRIINYWYPPFWNDDSICFHVDNNIGRVGHAMAGTWSTLAPSYMTMSQSEIQEANVKYLTGILVDLIAAAGRSLQREERLPSEYQERVEDIAKRALELHRMVRKDVSMDLVTYTVPPNTQFDPSQMDDTEGNANKAGSVPSDSVICTLEMGLQYRRKVESGKQGGYGKECNIILKPRVVLSAALMA